MSEFSKYRMSFDTGHWHITYNAFVTAVQTEIVALGTVIANLINTVGSLTLIQPAPTFTDDHTFSLPGDYTALLTVNKRLVADCGADGLKPNTVASCTYAAPNSTVVVSSANLTANLAAVSYYATHNGLNTYGSGDIVAGDYGSPSWTNLQAAANLANVSGRRLLLTPGTWPLLDNFTITAPVCLVPGAIISNAGATDKNLTINGSFEAGLYQVFSFSWTGKVNFSTNKALKEAYPQWWGAKGDGSTIDLLAIRALIASGAHRIVFPDTGSPYIVDATTYLVSNQEIILQGQATIRQISTALNPALGIFEFQNVTNIKIKGGILEGTNTTGLGVVYPYNITGLLSYSGGTNPSNILIEDTEIRYGYSAGTIFCGLASTNIKFVRVHIHHCADAGTFPSGDTTYSDCDIHDNQYAGIDAGAAFTGKLNILGGSVYRNGGVNGGGTQDYAAWCGILLNGTIKAKIIGTFIYDNGAEGIRIDTPLSTRVPTNIAIFTCSIYGHLTTTNPAWTPAGVRVTGGRRIILSGNDSHSNYDNYDFSPRDSGDNFVGLDGIVVNNNISSDATRYGYWVHNPISKKNGDVFQVGEIIRGLILSGNVSDKDAIPYQCDTYGSFWGRGNIIISLTETLGPELVVNGGFETGSPPSNWTPANGATLTQVTDHQPGSSGTKAINIARGTSSQGAISDAFGIVAGTMYKLSVWVKRITDVDSRPRVQIDGGTDNSVLSWWDAPADLPVNTWKEYTLYYVARTTENVNALLIGGITAGDEIRFNDLSIKAVTSDPTIVNVNNPRKGSFTCANNKDTVVTNPYVTATSMIKLEPTNAAAATLMSGATSLYTSAKTTHVSFTVTTANGAAAAGTETFNYEIVD